MDSAACFACLDETTKQTLKLGLLCAIKNTPLTGYQLLSEKGVANGYASLDGSGKVPSSQLPATGIGGTTGSTDNALLRADGTGGATAQASTVTIDDSGNIAHTNWSISAATYSGREYARIASLATNASLILTPAGTGYLSLRVPDGLFTGGNNRGNYAVDLTMERQLASQVASGQYAFTAGRRCTASADNTIAIGESAAATALNGISIGYNCTVSASFGMSLSSGGVTSASFATTLGYYSAAYLYGMLAHASGRFAATGDCQRARFIARNTTTNATPATLFLDGSAAFIAVPANSSGRARVVIIARRATAGAESMTWVREVAWQRGVAANTITIDVQTIGADRGVTGGVWGAGPPWSAAIVADTINGGFAIQGTGAAATNIRWGSAIDWMEITFA